MKSKDIDLDINMSMMNTMKLIADKVSNVEKQQIYNLRANYESCTKYGKPRFVASLVSDYGSTEKVAELLNLSNKYIKNLNNKSKKNGK